MTSLDHADSSTVPLGSSEYAEVVSFLYEEALTLDRGKYQEWLEMFAEDVSYEVPVRLTQMPKEGDGFVPTMGFFSEDKASLTMRVKRLQTDQAWAEQPNSRTRHLVGNCLVRRGESEGEYVVTSAIMVGRTRSDLPHDLFTGERVDVIRRSPEGLRIAERTVLLDETVLHSYNLSIFF